MSHRAINGIIQIPNKEVHFFFFAICCIVFNCSWQLIMFDKKWKSCIKRIPLVTDDSLYDQKPFYKVEIVFIHPLWVGNNISVLRFAIITRKIHFNVQRMPIILATIQAKSYFRLCWHCIYKNFAQWQILSKSFTKRRTNFWWKLAFFGIF